MANLFAIHSVGSSLITYLDHAYEPFRNERPCMFRLLSSGELAELDQPEDTMLSLFLHRVTVNEHLRNASQLSGVNYRNTPLALDLHYLMTVWSEVAATEHFILAWAMRELHQHQLLDTSSLSQDAQWSADEVVQLIPADLSNEDIMRIWDSLKPNYRLSVAYVARVIRLTPDEVEDARPVVATRFGWAELDDVISEVRP